MLKLRLSRGGTKKRPVYKVVVADSRFARDGRFIEKVGFFNPLLPKEKKERIGLEAERIKYWLGQGAQPTTRVARILGENELMPMPANSNNPQKATPKKDRKVVIYTTCFVNFNKKNTGVAALKVLKKNGVEVQEAYPGCCGMPFLEQADLPKVVEQAKKVSKDLLEWVDKGYKVITLTASCGLMLKFEWPLLLPKDDNIKRLSSNVLDIDEYVVDIANNEGLAEGLQEIDGGVTVHNACHARAQNMGIKSRDMLKLIPNVKLDVVERCAGHGGTFGVMKDTHDLANKVGRPTARQIKNKNNKYMASDCPLAGKHLKQLEVDTNISNDEALHPIELMAKSYNL